MDDSLAITLLRHGLTKENEKHAYIGWSDVSLSLKGREQLGMCRSLMNNFDLYVCSDLKRCFETSEILFPNQPFEKWSSFREMNFGEWEGKTFDELKEEERYQEWLTDFFSVHPPGGEGFNQFTERIDNGWRKLLDYLIKKDLNKALIISHGGVIRYLLSKFAPKEAGFWDWNIPHGTAFELKWTEKKGRGEVRCTSLQEVTLTENPSG
ncbi:histidine phosphatase family protein [Heyndrickxia sp. NPDC080065]|uniref:histidine phosphatase family protein n=1 Tax=Heyndrickxia sp. NPDC080065 TaxID=3390568 RepID=UPI003CFD219B